MICRVKVHTRYVENKKKLHVRLLAGNISGMK